MTRTPDLRRTLDSLPQAAVAFDPCGKIFFLNTAAENLFGWNRGELLGQPCPFFPEAGTARLQDDGKCLRLTKKNRSQVDLKVRVASMANPEGMVCTFEELLPHSHPWAHLEQFFQWGPGMFFLCRGSGDFGATFISENVRELLGYSPRDFIDNPNFWLNNIHPEDRPMVDGCLGELKETGRVAYEYRFRRSDGSYRWMADESRVIVNSQGEAEAIAGYWIDITERRRVEEALRSSEERFHRLFESAPDGIYLHTMDGTFLDANGAAERMTGYRREELIGKNFFTLDLIPPGHREQVAGLLDRNAKGETVGPIEIEIEHRDGSLVPIEVLTLPIEIEGQLQIFGIARDISERRQAVEQLRLARQRYQMITDNTPVFLYTLDPTGMFTFAEGAGMLQIDPDGEGLVGQNVHSRFGSLFWFQQNQVFTVSEAIERALGGEKMTGIVPLVELDCYFEARLLPQYDEAGRSVGLMGLAIDVTDRHKAEMGVREWQERFRAVVSNAPVVLFSFDREGRFTFSAGKGLKKTGLEDGEIVGQSVFELYAEIPFFMENGDIIPGSEAYRRALQGESQSGEVRMSGISFDTRLFPIFSKRGEVVGVHGISVDITERCQAEDELRHSEQKYRHISNEFRTVLNGIPDSLALLSPDLKIVWANSSGAREHAEEELNRGSCSQLWGMETKECPDCPVARAFVSAKTENATLATADGRVWGIKAFPLVGEDGNVTGVIEWASDITERVRMQEDAIHASRLASLGELAAGVAHEINNPNAMVLFNAPILADTWPDIARILDRHLETHGDFRLGRLPYARLREMMPSLHDGLLEGAQRIRRIVEDLKDFVRHDDGNVHEPVHLNEVVTAALRLLANTLQKTTTQLDIGLAPDLPKFSGNLQRLEQGVINLLLNACQALPSPDRYIRVSTSCDPSRRRLLLVVEDEGRGIAPEHLDRLTDPFFTTRRECEGTGLGLSVSARIVREHHGKLSFRSPAGQGTCVTLELPAIT